MNFQNAGPLGWDFQSSSNITIKLAMIDERMPLNDNILNYIKCSG